MSINDKKNIPADSEALYQTILENAPDAFLLGDSKGQLIGVNQKAVEITGYTKDELLKRNIRDLFSEDSLKAKPLRYDLLKSGQAIINERELITKSGNHIWIEMNSRAMPDGSYVSFFRNIIIGM